MIRQEKNIQRKSACYQCLSASILPKSILIVLAVFLFLFLPGAPVQAAANDILVYYTNALSGPSSIGDDIFETDLGNLGYNVNIVMRPAVIPPGGHLGLTPADPVNLLNYGQVWIIDDCGGADFTGVEINAVKTFRNAPNNGGLLLSADNTGCQQRVNLIAREFNSNVDLFFGWKITGGHCVSPAFTVHPLYAGLTSLSSTDSDAELNIHPASGIVITVMNGVDPYGAVLDDGAGGRIVFDTCVERFMNNIGSDCTDFCIQPPDADCSTEQESIYQQNIAQWLAGASSAACEDILIYVFPDHHSAGAFDTEITGHLAGEGYTVTAITRAGADELTPALLSGYGQIWIIDAGDDQPLVTPAEVTNLVNYYNTGGNILLTGEECPLGSCPEFHDDVDLIAQAFSTNMGFGPDGTENPCSNVASTASADSVFILNGVSTITTSGDTSNVFTTTTNPNVKSVATSTTGVDIVYVLDEPGPKGKIVFHPSYLTFLDVSAAPPGPGSHINNCDSAQYTKNVANWFCFNCSWIDDNCGDAPCSIMEMHQTCGPVGCTGNCAGGFSEGDTQCVLDSSCVVCPDGSCDFPETSIVDFGFEILCLEDCGCDNDTFCEAERGENFWNCALDCTVVAADCLCQENAKDSGGESLVPCGRNFDDRDTVSICECCPCTFCHTFLLMKRITDFAVKRGLPAILILAVMIAGALYLLGGFSGAFISKANDMFKIMGIGTAVIFAGWIVINIALYTITGNQTGSGVAQVFAGRWDEISCGYGVTCSTARCGDGIVQRPNFNGLDEECETDERWEGYKARAKAGEAIDTDGTVGANVIFGDIDDDDYWNTVNSCNEGSCLMGASPPPPPPPPNFNILVYYTNNSWTEDIFVTDLTNIGYSVDIIRRPAVIPPGGHLGLTAADPVNLLDYGQAWIIDTNFASVDFTPVEIAAVKTFRDAPNNHGLLLSAEHAGFQTRVNQLANQFNSNTDIFFGSQSQIGGSCCAVPILTAHPLYAGLTSLSSSDSDAELNIQNPAISIIATNCVTGDPYGAVLDDGAGGKIVFDTSMLRFIRFPLDCTDACFQPVPDPDCSGEQESIYQQNIAQWLD